MDGAVTSRSRVRGGAYQSGHDVDITGNNGTILHTYGAIPPLRPGIRAPAGSPRSHTIALGPCLPSPPMRTVPFVSRAAGLAEL